MLSTRFRFPQQQGQGHNWRSWFCHLQIVSVISKTAKVILIKIACKGKVKWDGMLHTKFRFHNPGHDYN